MKKNNVWTVVKTYYDEYADDTTIAVFSSYKKAREYVKNHQSTMTAWWSKKPLKVLSIQGFCLDSEE